MSKDLTAKRYLVIADYPGNLLPVGLVLELKKWNSEELEFKYSDDDEEHYYLSEKTLKRCDKNFRELQWWEMREESEMPEFVRWAEVGYMGYKNKLAGNIEPVREVQKYGNSFHFKIDSQINSIRAEYFVPATPEEYEQYIKSLK